MEYIVGGLYTLEDQFYIDYPDPYLKQNKEQHRPFYFCFCDNNTGLYWMIPMSSSEDKIELAKKKAEEGKTDIFHFTRVDRKNGVMLVADMCPVTAEYIASPYELSGKHVVFKDRKELKEIRAKASKVLRLLRKGIKFSPTQPDIFYIERDLLEKLKS